MFGIAEEFLIKRDCRIQFKEVVETPCGHVINKKCMKKHLLTTAKSCPVDGQVLPDDWILNNLGELVALAFNPIIPNEMDVAAGVVNFAEAA